MLIRIARVLFYPHGYGLCMFMNTHLGFSTSVLFIASCISHSILFLPSDFMLRCVVMLCYAYLCVRVVMICVDLMLPGVVGKERGGETVQGLEKGQTCAVALVGNGYVYI